MKNDSPDTKPFSNDIVKVLEKIAESVVIPKTIRLEEILSIPSFHASVRIQILNNKIYTSHIITEERNIQILRQLVETAKHHKLPNAIFVYNTTDQYTYPYWSHPIFTHSKIYGHPACNHILAPCFSFDYLNTHDKNIPHEDTYKNLISSGEPYLKNTDSWDKKEDKITFIGSLYNDRKINTQFPSTKNVDINIINKSQWDINYTPMEELTKYKYLLNLNGCGGGWSIRLKYLMLSGSLVFYILNYHDLEKSSNIKKLRNMDKYLLQKSPIYNIYCLYNVEYWMLCENFHEKIVLVTNVNECAKKLEYYSDHKEEAFLKANAGQKYVSEILSKKNVMLYWKILLETYCSRIKEPMNDLIYTVPFN